MLEVDLLRGGGNPGDRRPRLTLSRTPVAGFSPDPWTIGSGLTILASLALALYLFLWVRGRESALEEALDAALADSVRDAESIDKVRALQTRRDSVAARVSAIREIDARRYLWPRIMDEVAGVLPGEAWLTGLHQVAPSDDGLRFQVEGMTRSNVSLTRLWNGMEASPFIRNVQLVSTENVGVGSGDGGSGDLYHFVLRAEPEDPPPAMLNLVSFPPGVRQ